MSSLTERFYSEEDYEALLEQLHKTQEALEDYYLRVQALQEEHNREVQTLNQQHAQALKQLEVQCRAANERADHAEKQRAQSLPPTQLLRPRRLWKKATPLAVLGRLTRHPRLNKPELSEEAKVLLASPLFDSQWYLAQYPDVAQSNIPPVDHYLQYGATEGRQPSSAFDGKWYLEAYPDVAEAGLNPLLHFILFGQQEGRRAGP